MTDRFLPSALPKLDQVHTKLFHTSQFGTLLWYDALRKHGNQIKANTQTVSKMAERVASITLPQHRPDEDDLLASTFGNTTAGPKMKVNGMSTTGNDDVDDNACTEVATNAEDINAVKTSGVTSTSLAPSPTKDNASIVTVDSRPQYNFSKKDKENYRRLISLAHTAVRDNSTTVFTEEKEIFALTKMVSQMTHLLAASGMVSVISVLL